MRRDNIFDVAVRTQLAVYGRGATPLPRKPRLRGESPDPYWR